MPAVRKSRLRRLLRILVAAILLLLMAGMVLAWWAGVWLRPIIEQELQKHLNPRVSLAEPLQWRVWPSPSLVVRDLALRDENGVTLLAVRRAEFMLAQPALFSGRFELQHIRVDGASLFVEQMPGGVWNVAQWLKDSGSESDSSMAIPLIHEVRLHDATVSVTGGWEGKVEILLFEAAPVALDAPGHLALRLRLSMPQTTTDAPDAQKGIQLDTRADAAFRWHASGLEFDAVRLVASGEQAGDWCVPDCTLETGKVGLGFDGLLTTGHAILKGTFAPADAGDSADGETGQGMSARLSLEALSGRGQHWDIAAPVFELQNPLQQWAVSASAAQAVLALPDWRMSALNAKYEMTVSGQLLTLNAMGEADGQLSSQLNIATVTVQQGHFSMPHPTDENRTLDVDMTGNAQVDINAARAAGELRGSVEGSRFDGRWSSQWLGPALTTLTLKVDQIDVNRYLAEVQPSGADQKVTVSTGSADLTAWRQWPININAQVGQLRIRDVTGRDVHVFIGKPGATKTALD